MFPHFISKSDPSSRLIRHFLTKIKVLPLQFVLVLRGTWSRPKLIAGWRLRMRTHVLQHVEFENTGAISAWMKSRNATVTYTRFFAGDLLPKIDGLDCIVIMGGPMSVNDEMKFPWLHSEKDFIRYAHERGIPMIGICLGAQLIAGAFGARVYGNTHKEIGWFPVTSVPSKENTFRFPERFPAFHWHGETFDLPEGSVHLARSAGCNHQAFQIGNNVIGVQFHLETTPDSARRLVENCRDELRVGRYIQSEKQILEYPASGYDEIHGLMDRLLSYITA
jgi:GMP synthase-like glutamine amidotransferase